LFRGHLANFRFLRFRFVSRKQKKTGRSRKKNLGFFSGQLTNEGDLQISGQVAVEKNTDRPTDRGDDALETCR